MPKHLTLSDRIMIESSLTNQKTLGEIARELNRSVSTISREIRKHRVQTSRSKYASLNTCENMRTCKITGLCKDTECEKLCKFCNIGCYSMCPSFVHKMCERVTDPPYVCNGCRRTRNCNLTKMMYKAKEADQQSVLVLKESRSGFNMTEEEFESIKDYIESGIRQGHSVYNIMNAQMNERPCSESTVYRLINANMFSVRRVDMPRAGRFKKRCGKKQEMKIDKRCREGRTYQDYLDYCEGHPELQTTEMDSVIGRPGGKVLHTFILDNCGFMLAYLNDKNTAQSVIDNFRWLRKKMPRDIYEKLFALLLADNGSEFSNPGTIENVDGTGEIVSRLFYCDPSAPYQKPMVENNHGFIRRILPKGESFDELEQKDIDLMMSHINSYGRAKYNGISPAELFIQMYGEKVLHLLRQELIPAEKILLKPELLNR